MSLRNPIPLLSVKPSVLTRGSCSRCLKGLRLLQRRSYSNPTTIPQEPISPKPVDLRSQFSYVPPPPRAKRNLRPYIYAMGFLLAGLTVGQYMRLVILPPPLPLPDSKEDILMVEYLTASAERLPVVKSLMDDPAWKHHDAYEGFSPEAKKKRLTTGPMGGARALGGFQRIFYNQETGECISVIWIGGAIAGWPGVLHGGATGTILDESLGRAAINQLPARTGVTANLKIKYLKPVVTNAFYVVRAIPQKEGASEKKQWVSGRMESLDGTVCVEATGLFVVPKKFQLKTLESF